MPFCPTCRYEYVPGITECPDCYVDLVDSLDEPKSQRAPVPDDDFRLVSVGSFENYVEAEMVQLKLQSEGIESVLANDIVASTRAPGFIGGPFAVQVRVREEDAPRAAEIINEVMQGNGDER
jgi:hypothetical protein